MIDIYLASPYSHDDPSVMRERFHLACEVAAKLMEMGYTVFSPIAHSHPIAQYVGNQTDGPFWLKQDRPAFDASKTLGILRIDGWMDSDGMKEEFIWAMHEEKPIVYIDYIDRGYMGLEISLSSIPEKSL